MMERLKPIPLVFWKSAGGHEPVREWLNELPREDQRTIGHDIARVQFGWPVGLPPDGKGLVGSALVASEQARGSRLVRLSRRHVDRPYSVHQEKADDARGRIGPCAATMEGGDGMTRKNPHIGSTFESWLDEKGLREEVTASAIKSVIAEQIAAAMKERGLTKSRMAELMHTSRAQLDRLLDPTNGSATLETLMRAAKVIGRELRLELR
jgi:antitoxin HicB